MSKQIKLNSRQSLFIIKTAACFAALMLGFFGLSQTASMQDTTGAPPPPAPMSANMRAMGNYKPTPEPPKSTIRGRVIYADTGRAVRRAGLMLMSSKGAGGREKAGVTNERGEFEIKDVAEGRYFVSVSTPGVLTPFSSISNFDRPAMQNSAALADIARDFEEVVVNGITDADVTVVVKRGAAITGKIMYTDGEAAIGVRVEVLRKKDGQYNAVVPNISEIFGAMLGGAAGGLKTDDRGVFRIAGLPAGEYVVRAVENVAHSSKGNNRDDEFAAIIGINPTSLVATYYPNTNDVEKAETLKIELGQEQAEVNITIPERALHDLSGTAINRATREPIKNARISLRGENSVNSMFGGADSGTKTETDEQGHWNYKEIPAGKYTLIVKPPYDYQSNADTNSQKAKPPKLAEAQKEIVVEDKSVKDLNVELGYGASISGSVSFDNQQPISQPIFVTAADAKGKFTETDFVGGSMYDEGDKAAPKKSADFKIEGIGVGQIFLNAAGAGDADGGQFYVKSILSNGKDISRAPLEIKEGDELKGVQIVLSRDVGKVKGTVRRADKSPAAGARILFVSTDKSQWENSRASLYAVANGDGEFETFGAPGEYFAVFINENDLNKKTDEAKTVVEKRREWLERETASAQKVTIKAKETEKISLITPEK